MEMSSEKEQNILKKLTCCLYNYWTPVVVKFTQNFISTSHVSAQVIYFDCFTSFFVPWTFYVKTSGRKWVLVLFNEEAFHKFRVRKFLKMCLKMSNWKENFWPQNTWMQPHRCKTPSVNYSFSGLFVNWRLVLQVLGSSKWIIFPQTGFSPPLNDLYKCK